jgi:hypothetical protein
MSESAATPDGEALPELRAHIGRRGPGCSDRLQRPAHGSGGVRPASVTALLRPGTRRSRCPRSWWPRDPRPRRGSSLPWPWWRVTGSAPAVAGGAWRRVPWLPRCRSAHVRGRRRRPPAPRRPCPHLETRPVRTPRLTAPPADQSRPGSEVSSSRPAAQPLRRSRGRTRGPAGRSSRGSARHLGRWPGQPAGCDRRRRSQRWAACCGS